MPKQTIAIIGATCKSGTAIAKGLAKSNYRLLLFADDRTNLNSLAGEIRTINPLADIDCMGCAADASWEADIIIPAVPLCIQKDIAHKIELYANRKIVISIPDSLNETGINAGEELQKLLPGAKVVKAFDTSSAKILQPVNKAKQNEAFISDDEEVLQTIDEILKMIFKKLFNQ